MKTFFLFQISSLVALSDNMAYHNILRLYADDNQIDNIAELEGTKFFQEFDIFYLRRNKIRTVSVSIHLKVIFWLIFIIFVHSISHKFFFLNIVYYYFQLPIYMLSNTLDKSPDGRLLYLEGNHITCDCNSAKVLKVRYNYFIKL